MPCGCISGVCQLFGRSPARKPVSEEDKALLDCISRQGLLELLGEGVGGRVYSLSTEKDLGNKTAFKAKPLRQEGDAAEPTLAVGLTCRKGLKPGSPNQDSAMLLQVEGDFSLYGVFGGHGSKGHEASDFVKDVLPKLIVEDARFKEGRRELAGVLQDAFAKTQDLISAHEEVQRAGWWQRSGTNATIVVHEHKSGRLTVANVARSACALGKGPGADGRYAAAVKLTVDHAPDDQEERRRVEQAGGCVVFDGLCDHRINVKDRTYPGLSMARAFGDTLSRAPCGIIEEPTIRELDLQEEDRVLILGSFGLWTFLTEAEAARCVGLFKAEKAKAAAEKLAKLAWDRWIQEEGGSLVEDITVLVVGLRDPPPS